MATENPSDRAGRDAETELSQVALDADTSPTPILPTEANNEPDQIIGHRWAPRASLLSPTPPLVLGSFAMPAQQRLGGDQEGSPPCPREQTAECGENGPIRRSISHAPVQLTLKDPDRVSEHHDLDVMV